MRDYKVWPDGEIGVATKDAFEEAEKAMKDFPPFNTAHEAYAVLLEEVDELWDHVKSKQGSRNVAAMRKECIQVAAMAIRFATDICNEEKGRK
jgi:NTP pyrophosphatase (non-canonical NTP hydrolase)